MTYRRVKPFFSEQNMVKCPVACPSSGHNVGKCDFLALVPHHIQQVPSLLFPPWPLKHPESASGKKYCIYAKWPFIDSFLATNKKPLRFVLYFDSDASRTYARPLVYRFFCAVVTKLAAKWLLQTRHTIYINGILKRCLKAERGVQWHDTRRLMLHL